MKKPKQEPRKPPPNEGNLPTETDEEGNVTILWKGSTIRQQFPWTRAVGEKK